MDAPRPRFEIMIWGCVSCFGVGTLASVDGNINSVKYQEILDDNLWLVLVHHFLDGNCIFQDDNAPVHRSHSTREFIHRNGIKTMSWPAQSPDINIIENLWLFIKRKLQSRVYIIKSKDDLFTEVQQIWMNITPDIVKCLYRFIPRRILRLKGHLTQY